jgi:hypothetical protein
MGRLAINPEQLGINDPLTHLYQYLEADDKNKNRMLENIKIDLETDIAERLPKTPFVNKVEFEYSGTDFISVQDKISMKSMTSTNLRIFKEMLSINPVMLEEFARAKIEAMEVNKLSDWFNNAAIGEYLIFESLPIGEQTIAISRIYQKTNHDKIEGSFVSLYNPSVEQFNNLRSELDIDTHKNTSVIEILENNYSFYSTNLKDSDKFIDYYVENYDLLLEQSTGKEYNFGLESDISAEKQNGILKVRGQPKLTDTYLEIIKTLVAGQGIATSELIKLTSKINIKNLNQGDTITTQIARNILGETIKKITSVIDMASDDLLDEINRSDASPNESYDAMSHFGEQADSTGKEYTSNNCPEYNREGQQVNKEGSEYDILSKIFGNEETPDNFGKPKIGVCRIYSCPSRGDSKWWPRKTLVGGCDVCVSCHHLFSKGKSPDKVHRTAKQNEKKRLNKIAKKKKEQGLKSTD